MRGLCHFGVHSIRMMQRAQAPWTWRVSVFNCGAGKEANIAVIKVCTRLISCGFALGLALSASASHAADMTARQVTQLLFATAAGSTPDLSNKDLSGLDLSGLDFKKARLDGVNFYGADLSGANLSGASLKSARLDRATLIGANFSSARYIRRQPAAAECVCRHGGSGKAIGPDALPARDLSEPISTAGLMVSISSAPI